RTDRGGEYMDTLYFQSVGIIHDTTAPYTLQQNGISERKNRVLKEMVNSMLSYSGLSQRVWGCRAPVRFLDLKLKTLGERGIECFFVGYAEHSKAFRFYVIKPNDSVAINSIIELRDAIFDEQRFSSVPRPSQRSLVKGTKDSGGLVVSERVTNEIVQQSELRKSKRHRTPKDFGPEFQLYLIERTWDEDVAFWKEAINDEIDSIMGNNTWVLTDLPPGCKPLGCKWIFKRKLKMDVKTAFLNEELEEEVYMNQPIGFIMPGNENKVDLNKEFLSSRFSMKDMRDADFILGIRIKHESNVSTPLDTYEKLMPNRGLVVSQLEYSRMIGCLMYDMTCTRPDIAFVVGKLSRLVYSSYPSVLKGYTDASWISNIEDNSSTSGWVFLVGGGVISWASKKQTCITGSNIESKFVALAAASKEAEWLKNLLLEIPLWVKPMSPTSTRCDSAATLAKAYSQMYDEKSKHIGVRHSMIRELIMNGVVSIEFMDVKTAFLNKELEEESHYIEKVLKKFNYSDCTLVSTPLDTCKKLMPNRGLVVSQLEYSRMIGCLMYDITCTRPDIAFVVGKLSRYTSNLNTQHWQAIHKVLKYLKKTMDYRLVYSGYPSVLKGYTDASWISNIEDNSSISGWLFLLGGGAISWASKKQTCITGSNIESKFVALAAASKEAEWLKNLLLEIPLWVKPMSPISTRCDSAATLAKAYSQMYNEKSKHIGVRHSMIRELITNGVVSIEFARSQQNLADHLTKGLALNGWD
nr:zinc finger, CCHC-type [Tanacetum cinerariifolium]